MAPPSGPYASVPGGSNDHFRLDSSDEVDGRDGNNSEAMDDTERGRRSIEDDRRAGGREEEEEVGSGDEDEIGLLGREVETVEQFEVDQAKAGTGRRWYQKVSHYSSFTAGHIIPQL